MEKLNIKLLLNAIAAEEMMDVEHITPVRDETVMEDSNMSLQAMYSDLERSLDKEDGFHASLFGLLKIFDKRDRCFKKLLKKLSGDKTYLKFLKSGAKNSTIESLSADSLQAIAKYVTELIQWMKDNNCWDSLPLPDVARELAKIFGSKGRAAEVIKNILDGVKNMADGFGEILAGIRPDLVRQYASVVAVSNAQLAQQCSGLSATEATLLVAGGVALIAAIVLTGGAAGILAAKLAAVGGGLAICGTALSADDLASAGEEAARLEREYFDSANVPNTEEEYIDNVLDPSGLSDVSDYPGNSGG